MQFVAFFLVLVALPCIGFLVSARAPERQFNRPLWPFLLFLPVSIAAGLIFAFAVLHGFANSEFQLSAAVVPILVTLFFLIYAIVFGSADIVYRAISGRWMPSALAVFFAASIVFMRFIVPTGWFGIAEGTTAATKKALSLPLPVDLITAFGSFAVVAVLIYTLRAVTRERAV